MGTTSGGYLRLVILPISEQTGRLEIGGMKMPSHPRALALLAAILPVMDRRTRRSAAWMLITVLSATFWSAMGLLAFLLLR